MGDDMKRNLIYSLLVFGLLFSWLVSGAITQISLGVLGANDLTFFFGFSIFLAGIVAAIFFVVFRAIRDKFYGGTVETGYRPSRKFTAVAVTLLTMSIVGGVVHSYSAGKEKAEAVRAEVKRKEDAAKALADRQEKEEQRLAAMTSEERVADARIKEESVIAPIIQEGETILKRRRAPDSKPVTKQEWDNAKARLNSIKETQPQYQKAKALLTEMAVVDKKAAAANAVLLAKARVEARKDFARTLENTFIEKRMNTDVTANGPKNTILHIKWVLATKVTANDLSKSGLLQQAENAGFKKVAFTDGYDREFYWDLQPIAD